MTVHGPHPGDALWRGFCIITSASHLHLRPRARCCPVPWAACLNFDFSSCFSSWAIYCLSSQGRWLLLPLSPGWYPSVFPEHQTLWLSTMRWRICAWIWFIVGFPLARLDNEHSKNRWGGLAHIERLDSRFLWLFLRVLVHEVGVYRERLWFTVGFTQWVLFEPSAGAPLAGAMGLHAGFSVLGPSVSVLLNSWCLETTKDILGDAVMNRATHRQTDRGFRNKLALHVSHTTLFTKALGEEREEFHR